MNIMLEIAEILRRIENLIKVGRVSQINIDEKKVRVTIGELETDWITWGSTTASGDSEWHPLTIGEQVLLLSPSAELSNAIIVCSIPSVDFPGTAPDANVHKKEFSDGAIISYDKATHTLSAELPAGATVNITATGGITFSGDLHVAGNITSDGNLSDSVGSLARLRTNYNTAQYTTISVGSLTSTTSKPDV